MAARTYNFHDKLHKIAKNNVALLTRLQLAFDVMAGDVLYHVNCIRTQMREGEGSEQHGTCSSEKGNRDFIYEQLWQYWSLIAGGISKSYQKKLIQ